MFKVILAIVMILMIQGNSHDFRMILKVILMVLKIHDQQSSQSLLSARTAMCSMPVVLPNGKMIGFRRIMRTITSSDSDDSCVSQ